MTINVEKSAVIVTEPNNRGRKIKEEQIPYWLKYKVVSAYKYLGVEVQENGKIDAFIDRIGRKVNGCKWKLHGLRKVGS